MEVSHLSSIPSSAPLSSLDLSHSAPQRVVAASLDHKIYVIPYSTFLDPTSDAQPTVFNAHDGPVYSAKWASPCFGSLIASGGGDGVVNVWEEDSDGKWTRKCSMDEAKAPIREVEWGPYWGNDEGIRLASIASDSHLRVYLSLDSTFSDWTLTVSLDLHLTFTSLSPTINTTRDYLSSSLATLTSTGGAQTSKGTTTSAANGGWSLSWIPSPFWGDRLAVAFGLDPIVRLIYLPSSPSHPPRPFLQLEPTSPNLSPVTSIAWSTSTGRSFQLIAVGHRDGSMRIWKLLHPKVEGDEDWIVDPIAEFGWEEMGGKGIHGTRVQWNSTGTILSATCGDGGIRVFKPTFIGEWKCVSIINGDWEEE